MVAGDEALCILNARLESVSSGDVFAAGVVALDSNHRDTVARCLGLARNVRTESTGKWIFRKSRVIGLPEFREAWRAPYCAESISTTQATSWETIWTPKERATRRSSSMSSRRWREYSPACSRRRSFSTRRVRCRISPRKKLHAFCGAEYGTDAPGMIEAIRARIRFTRVDSQRSPQRVWLCLSFSSVAAVAEERKERKGRASRRSGVLRERGDE